MRLALRWTRCCGYMFASTLGLGLFFRERLVLRDIVVIGHLGCPYIPGVSNDFDMHWPLLGQMLLLLRNELIPMVGSTCIE